MVAESKRGTDMEEVAQKRHYREIFPTVIDMDCGSYLDYLSARCQGVRANTGFSFLERKYRIFDDSEAVRAKPRRRLKVQVQPKPEKKRTVYTKACKVCGKEFQTTYPNKVICSDECRTQLNRQLCSRWYRSHKDESKNIKICPVCGKEFKAQRVTAVCCCSKCTRKYYTMTHPPKKRKKIYKPKPKTEKVCQVCGKTFLAKRYDMKFCSTDCYEKNRRVLLRNARTNRNLEQLESQ